MKPDAILVDFESSLRRFAEAVEIVPIDDIHRAGCIQYFEFTFDLAWKSIQSLGQFYGLDTLKSPRAAIKAAYEQGWIYEQSPWLRMLEARNRMSHVYRADEALEVYKSLQSFRLPLEQLYKSLVAAYRDG